MICQPSFIEKEASGVHDTTSQSIIKRDVDIGKDLHSNRVLSDGAITLAGIVERITKELAALAPSNVEVEIVAPLERKYSAWIGGSILSLSSIVQRMWLSRDEEDESSPTMLRGKCFRGPSARARLVFTRNAERKIESGV